MGASWRWKWQGVADTYAVAGQLVAVHGASSVLENFGTRVKLEMGKEKAFD